MKSFVEPEAVKAECESRLSDGMRLLSMGAMEDKFRALGYEFDKSMSCNSIAKWLSGPRTGKAYPVKTLSPREVDTKKSAYNVEARRDKNFEAMQALRQEVFAMSQGRIVEV